MNQLVFDDKKAMWQYAKEWVIKSVKCKRPDLAENPMLKLVSPKTILRTHKVTWVDCLTVSREK